MNGHLTDDNVADLVIFNKSLPEAQRQQYDRTTIKSFENMLDHVREGCRPCGNVYNEWMDTLFFDSIRDEELLGDHKEYSHQIARIEMHARHKRLR